MYDEYNEVEAKIFHLNTYLGKILLTDMGSE